MPGMTYNLIYIYKIDDAAHKGYLKIGKASMKAENSPAAYPPNCDALNLAAKKRINGETVTPAIAYDLVYTEIAVRNTRFEDGTEVMRDFVDDDVKNVLKSSGVKIVYPNGVSSQEWYETNLPTAINAIAAVKEWRTVLTPAEIVPDDPSKDVTITLREEQEEAVQFTLECMKKSKKILWNAKMRFGKTLTALEVVKRKGFQKTIIVTHRPVVGSGWQEDFHKIFKDSSEYTFHFKQQTSGSADEGKIDAANEQNLKRLVAGKKKFIYFASVQDLRGSKRVDGPYNKNNAVFDIEWDLIINDEAHEGTQTELGKDVFEELLKNTQTGKQSTKTVMLALSGTPFNILDQYDDNVYTWDYVMEQKRKEEWGTTHPGEPNPYADLPQMHIYTYSLGQLIKGYMKDDLEGKSFNFYEFFRTWTGDPNYDRKPLPAGAKIGDFVHTDDVRSFLDLIVQQNDSKYPFSTQEYRDLFKHTLWMLPGVKEARALSAMLKEHSVFGKKDDAGNRIFGIINVAGDGDAEQAYDDALKAVREGISNYQYTITLSCGKLTTGVTVKEWTAVMMLAGTSTTAASGYMQTIFRVQSAGKIDGKQKTDCYVFDFAPDRTLSVLAEAAHVSNKTGRRGKNEEQNRKAMQDFLNYCPVIAIEGTEMKPYSVNAMMEELKHIFVAKAIRNGFDDYSIYNDSLLDLSEGDFAVLNGLKAVIGKSKRQPSQTSIPVNEEGLNAPPVTDNPEGPSEPITHKTPTSNPDAEEKKRKRKEREEAIAILRAVSIRMPLLIYGADVPFDDDITIEEFAELVDEESWKEFMPNGVTKEKFAEITKFYDRDVFISAGREIRKLAKSADTMVPTERVKKITEVFNYFKNPDKETVLTPWRVVNMHMSDIMGGWCFYNEKFEEDINNERQHIVNRLAAPRFVDRGKVTSDVLANQNARVLEINSKSGLYPLYVAYSIYRAKLEDTSEEDWTLEQLLEFWAEAVRDNVFVVCKTPMAEFITRRTLAGYRGDITINTRSYDDLLTILKENPDFFISTITSCDYWDKEGEKMTFDAVVGNPPYQLEGGSGGSNDAPIYQYFGETASQLNPSYYSLIIPARWFAAGRENLLGDFRKHMLNNRHLQKMITYTNSSELFPTVEIKGGICYFLVNNEYEDDCEYTLTRNGIIDTIMRNLGEFDLLIRDPKLATVVRKVMSNVREGDKCVDSLISNDTPFGISSNPKSSKKNPLQVYPDYSAAHDIKLYHIEKNKRKVEYIKRKDIKKNENAIDSIKVFVPGAGGSGDDPLVLGKPEYAPTKSVCSQSYIFAKFETEEEAQNFIKYLNTKFFRALVASIKISQSAANRVYQFVPVQDFTSDSDINWNNSLAKIDEELFKKYKLDLNESDYIKRTFNYMD